ncbi:MAG: flagellar basal body P-ring formation chaperone FlgA [Alphaproteobacteria bacterium]|nr:flagellar basal body P-ring formation chaperone FlgA [Alphaproteobacteria bacterium]
MKKLLNLLLFLGVTALSTPKAFAEPLYVLQENVQQAILAEFENQGMEDEVEIEVYGGQTSFQFDKGETFKILVSGLRLDEASGKFFCSAEVFVDGKMAHKTDLQGRYFIIAKVYVPSVNLQKGDLIKEENLKQISMRLSKIKPQYIIEKEKIIGMEVKKPLREGRLIGSRDIGKHTLIKKGNTVNMLYSSAGIQIVAKGVAMTDGGKDDKIEVMNSKSKKSIFAIIIDKDNVEVR